MRTKLCCWQGAIEWPSALPECSGQVLCSTVMVDCHMKAVFDLPGQGPKSFRASPPPPDPAILYVGSSCRGWARFYQQG